MTTWLIRCFAGLLLVLPFVPAVADDPDDKEIARLVKQLGSSDFRTRDEARKRLEEIGEPALDALHKATINVDLESRRRAEQLVAVIEDKVYPELVLTGHTKVVWRVSISADGKRLLTCSDDKTLRLWDAHTGKCLRVFEGHTDGVRGAALSPDGKRVLSGGGDKTVRLWDADTGKAIHNMTGHTDAVFSVAFGPEGQAISSGSADGTMHLWDLNTGKNAGVFSVNGSGVLVAYSAKARLAVTCGCYGPIHLWNLETGKEVRRIAGGFTSVCFSPDGKRLLSAAGDHWLYIWDVETGKALKQISAPNAVCVAVSPDGKRLVSGGWNDKTVRVWDAESGKELRKYTGHAVAQYAFVVGVAFFPDGKRLASASADGTARIWRAPR